MPLKVALIGEEGAGVKTLQLLADRGHRIAVVFTDSGGGGPVASVASVAESLGLRLRPAAEVRAPAAADWLRSQEVELLLNVHSLHVVHASVLEAPPLGAYNLHPGPLPERAGLNVPSWALYEGADSHGVTLHRMTPEVDAGAIAFADSFDLGPGDTGLSVITQCVRRGLRLVEKLLDVAERGEPIPAHPQDLARRRWFGAGPPEDGRLDWNRPARRILDFVRACDYGPFDSPWGFPRCAWDGADVAIRAVRATERRTDVAPGTIARGDGGAVSVAASDVWVEVTTVEVDGQELAAADVLRDGERFDEPTSARPA